MTDPSQPSTRAKEARQKSGREVSVYLRRAFYRLMRIVARVVFVLWFRIRVEGRHHVPLDGGGMLLSTHQSGIDPILVGLSCNRNLNYLARSTLFKNPAFSFLIRILDAIEIDRERGGLGGLREMLSRLRSGELVLLFPEGTRTTDGSIGSLKPGFLPIAKRSEVPLIPVAIVGAFECMPKGS
ncbi:MAG: lysophospholipid acyltransferase family protein, partial [Planctomycetota bacterium]